MPLAHGRPVPFTPKGLSDAYDATQTFPGACLSLQNLVFNRGNPELLSCRPGVLVLTSFAGFTTPTFITVHIAIGSVVYGMVSTGRNAGRDEPFAYDIDGGAFVAISGVTATNTPASPATSGAWTPPSMTVVGTKILVTHPGFSGTGTNTSSITGSITASTVLVVTAAVGTIYVGMVLTGGSATIGTTIVALGSGTGGAGTYTVSVSQTAAGPFSGSVAANFFGVIDITNPGSPIWSGQQLAFSPLPSVPNVVANLNNRAYFACLNVLYFSDILVPTSRTNASQSLTLGDPTPITALAGLPVQTTSSGVLQTLLAFKASQIWQISGDVVLSNLALNYVSLTVGTSAPRSVTQTPFGTNFMAIDGPYLVDPVGVVRPLTGSPEVQQQDIQNPFIYATQPSRVSAGYSGGTYRICVSTTLELAAVTNEYWFDIERHRWNGPHTWPQDCCSQVGNYFAVSHVSKGAVLFKSQLIQDVNSVFTDNGVQISFQLESATLPKNGNMNEKSIVESTIELSTTGSVVNYQITALNGLGTTIDNTTILVQSAGYLWGTAVWGSFSWNSAINRPGVYTIPWTKPLVFQKFAVRIAGQSSNNIAIGTFYARYQDLGYTNMEKS